MNVTAESIARAHAEETHPSAGERAYWNDETLTRPSHAEDSTVGNGEVTLLMRVTYWNADHTAPSESADYAAEISAEDSSLRDARDISRHADVFGVALYPQHIIDDTQVMRSPVPVVVFDDGEVISL